MLTIKGEDTNPTIINVRTGEKELCTWDQVISAMESFCNTGNEKKSWEETYAEAFPEEKEEVAPVQQKQPKPTKVTKAKTETKTRQRIQELFEGEKKEIEDLAAEAEEIEECDSNELPETIETTQCEQDLEVIEQEVIGEASNTNLIRLLEETLECAKSEHWVEVFGKIKEINQWIQKMENNQ